MNDSTLMGMKKKWDQISAKPHHFHEHFEEDVRFPLPSAFHLWHVVSVIGLQAFSKECAQCGETLLQHFFILSQQCPT